MRSTNSTIRYYSYAHSDVEYCIMTHRGRILKKKMKENGVSVTEASLKFGYASRNSMYNQFRKPDADIRLFIFLSKTYGIDFSIEIPEFKSEFVKDLLSNTSTGELGIMPVSAHLKEMDVLKNKLIETLDALRIVMDENTKMRKELLIRK